MHRPGGLTVKPASPECGHPFMRKVDWNMPRQSYALAPFCIDMYEFPNQPGGQPTTCLTYADAEKLCTDAGKRLCTSLEWETACVGTAPVPASIMFAICRAYCMHMAYAARACRSTKLELPLRQYRRQIWKDVCASKNIRKNQAYNNGDCDG